jgi:hypothetical protein
MTKMKTSHMLRVLALLFGASFLLLADDGAMRKVQVTHTERADFPSGGRLQLKNSIGELMVEGWDRPDVEITTIKSTKTAVASGDREKASRELDKVRISVAPQAGDLVVTTDFPRHRSLLPTWRRLPDNDFDLEYRIKVPMNAKLSVDHVRGEVHVYNLTSDIRATDCNGLITLELPPDGSYDIDAKSKLGDVISDFAGHKERTRLFGHRFIQGKPAPHKLYLRIGFGDIIIFEGWKPASQ